MGSSPVAVTYDTKSYTVIKFFEETNIFVQYKEEFVENGVC